MAVHIEDILYFQSALARSQVEIDDVLRNKLENTYDPVWWTGAIENSWIFDDGGISLTEAITGEDTPVTHDQLKILIAHLLANSTQETTSLPSSSSNDVQLSTTKTEVRIDVNRNARLPESSIQGFKVSIATALYAIYRSIESSSTIVFYDSFQKNVFAPDIQMKNEENLFVKRREEIFPDVDTINVQTQRPLGLVDTVVKAELGNAVLMRDLLATNINNDVLDKIERAYDELNKTVVHNSASVDSVLLLDGTTIKFINFSKSFTNPTPSEYERIRKKNWLGKAPSEPIKLQWDLLCFYISAILYYQKINRQDLAAKIKTRFEIKFYGLIDVDDSYYVLPESNVSFFTISFEGDGTFGALWDTTADDDRTTNVKFIGDDEDDDEYLSFLNGTLDFVELGEYVSTEYDIKAPTQKLALYRTKDRTKFVQFQVTNEEPSHEAQQRAAAVGFAPKILRQIYFDQDSDACRYRTDEGLGDEAIGVDVVVTPAYKHTLADIIANEELDVKHLLKFLEGAFNMLREMAKNKDIPMNTRCFVENMVVTTRAPVESVKRPGKMNNYFLLTDYSRTWDGSADTARYETERMNNLGPSIDSRIYDRLCFIISVAHAISSDRTLDYDGDKAFDFEDREYEIMMFLEGELGKLRAEAPERIHEESVVGKIRYVEDENELVFLPFIMFRSEWTELD